MGRAANLLKMMRAMKEAQESAKEKADLNAKDSKIYDKLIKDLRERSYPEAVDYIDKVVEDDKLKFLLGLGFGGPLSDIKLTSENCDLDVITLMPTQNEIDIDKSLAFILKDAKDKKGNTISTASGIKKFFQPKAITIIAPIVTFNKQFIIDGHHRWSQTYCANPDAKITAINFSGRISPLQMLKAVQATIGSNLGEVPSQKVDGSNIYNVKKDYLLNYMEKNLQEEHCQAYIEATKGSPDHRPLTNRKEVIDFLVNNCITLKGNNHPILGAPERGIMPQTDEDENAIPDLKIGITKI